MAGSWLATSRGRKRALLAALGLLSVRPLCRLLLAACFRCLTRAFQLRPPRPGRIRRLPWTGTLRVPSARGAALDTVAYIRPDDTPVAPTLLIRTPYSKRPLEVFALAIASQGLNVVVQDCRGRFGSSGEQTFGAHEDLDGVATAQWLATQGFSWFDPRKVVLWGASYLGIVQWALLSGLSRERRKATGSSPALSVEVVAFAPMMSSSRVFDISYHNNMVSYDFYVRYMDLMTGINSLPKLALCGIDQVRIELRLRKLFAKCTSTKDLHRALNVPVRFKYNNRRESKFWQVRDYSAAIGDAPPAIVSSGWYDLLLETSLKDYEDLVEAHGPGKHRLLVGPWHHLEGFVDLGAVGFLLRESLDFLMRHAGLLPEEEGTSEPVRLWIMGARSHDKATGSWKSFSEWPPADSTERPLMLTSKGALRLPSADAELSAAEEPPSRFVYDPLRPTPSLCGNVFNFVAAGECDQQTREAREDVLLFETEPLLEDIVVVGRPRVRLPLRTSLPFFDVHLRLCDVQPSGQSFNVCDGYMRRAKPLERAQSHQEMPSGRGAGPLGGPREATASSVELRMWGTAKRFAKGHRIRLQVSGGAYPQLARNFGDSEQQVEDTPLEIRSCVFELLHQKDLPPVLWLPVLPGEALPTPPPMRRRKSLEEAAILRDVGAWASSPKGGLADLGPLAWGGMRRVASASLL